MLQEVSRITWFFIGNLTELIQTQLKDIHREKKPTKLKAHEKYEYGHLSTWYIKSIIYDVLTLKLNLKKKSSG